jgi:hypothetical protein
MSSSSKLRYLEISLNNVFRKIWSLPWPCHTGILHQVAGMNSIHNTVITRSSKLLLSASNFQSPVLFKLYPGFYQFGRQQAVRSPSLKGYSDQDSLFLASSPGHSHFFNVTRRREGRPGRRNHMSVIA